MRILYLLTQDLESPSGLGRYWPLAHALADRGHELRIAGLSSQWSALEDRKFYRNSVEIQYVAPMHVMKEGSRKEYYSTIKLVGIALQGAYGLGKAALSTPVDIIHICKPHPMNSIAGMFASKTERTTLCLDCDDYEAESNRFTSNWQKNIVSIFEKRTPFYASMITTNTHFMESRLIDWGYPAERIVYLPNGIERERFHNVDLEHVSSLRKALGLEGKKVIIYIGSLSLVNHAVDILLDAFKIITQKNNQAVLLIVGGGEDYLKLIHQAETLEISKDTIFTGRINPAEVADYYALSDVSVDPVRDDYAARGRSPLKLFESWTCGVPFVTSPVGDREALLGDPCAGLLIRPAGDPSALASGILEILQSESLAMELHQRGLAQVKQYTWDILATQLEQAYVKLL